VEVRKLSGLPDKPLTLNEYQDFAAQTALYPEAGKQKPIGLIYAALKGAGEAGEFAEKVGKAIRDEGYATEKDELTFEKRGALIKEVGDLLWYCAAQARELGVTLEEVARHNIMKLTDRAERDMIKGSGDER
jgi:NTP pyrophosphatase (non-canonical NTP hydrolase)